LVAPGFNALDGNNWYTVIGVRFSLFHPVKPS